MSRDVQYGVIKGCIGRMYLGGLLILLRRVGRMYLKGMHVLTAIILAIIAPVSERAVVVGGRGGGGCIEGENGTVEKGCKQRKGGL